MSNPYTLICRKTGEIKGKITCDDHIVIQYENDDTEVIDGHHCYRGSYRCCHSGAISERIDADMKVDALIAIPQTEIHITKPSDCWIMVDGDVTLDDTFIVGDRDFRATAVGKYIGEVHVVVRYEETIRQEQMRVAFENWFKTTPEGQAAFNGDINCGCGDMKSRLDNS